jgi:hypothetical protein
MFMQRLRQHAQDLFPRPGRRPRRAAPSRRLCVEVLEDRTVPSGVGAGLLSQGNPLLQKSAPPPPTLVLQIQDLGKSFAVQSVSLGQVAPSNTTGKQAAPSTFDATFTASITPTDARLLADAMKLTHFTEAVVTPQGEDRPTEVVLFNVSITSFTASTKTGEASFTLQFTKEVVTTSTGKTTTTTTTGTTPQPGFTIAKQTKV